jgi:hypothetical protein
MTFVVPMTVSIFASTGEEGAAFERLFSMLASAAVRLYLSTQGVPAREVRRQPEWPRPHEGGAFAAPLWVFLDCASRPEVERARQKLAEVIGSREVAARAEENGIRLASVAIGDAHVWAQA